MFYNKWWKRDGKPEYFTLAEHQALRAKPMRKDVWETAAQKLVGFGWLTQSQGGYRITPEGVDAAKRIAARNAGRPDRNGLNKD